MPHGRRVHHWFSGSRRGLVARKHHVRHAVQMQSGKMLGGGGAWATEREPGRQLLHGRSHGGLDNPHQLRDRWHRAALCAMPRWLRNPGGRMFAVRSRRRVQRMVAGLQGRPCGAVHAVCTSVHRARIFPAALAALAGSHGQNSRLCWVRAGIGGLAAEPADELLPPLQKGPQHAAAAHQGDGRQ